MTNKEYIDSLPKKVKEQMLTYQEELMGFRDIEKFYEDPTRTVGGFLWANTKEGRNTWGLLLGNIGQLSARKDGLLAFFENMYD